MSLDDLRIQPLLARAVQGLTLALVASACAQAQQPSAATSSPNASATASRPQALVQCAACHGPVGISSAPETPHLAGMPAGYLAAQLRAYRSGARKNEVMGVMAKALSESDIEAIAAWYAAVKIEAKVP